MLCRNAAPVLPFRAIKYNDTNPRHMTTRLQNSLIAIAGMMGLWLIAFAANVPSLVAEKSKIEFVGSKASASHKGGFKIFKVDGNIDWDDLSKSSVNLEIDANSVWSDDGGLTSHLKNRDFFNVDKFPVIQFEATKIELGSDEMATVSGKLTMLGQAVDMSIPCKITASESGLTVKAKFAIDRTNWGMNYGQGRVNNDVDVLATLVFTR
jgi:polyisoprenoid-binding protein YceI